MGNENTFIQKVLSDKELYDKLMYRFNEGDPFSALAGIKTTAIGDGWAEGELEITPSSMNPVGVVHGGCIVTLCDTVAGTAVFSTGVRSVTLNSNTNFLREARAGKITCRAEMVKPGRTISVCDVAVRDEDDRLIATGSYTFFVKELAEDALRRLDEA